MSMHAMRADAVHLPDGTRVPPAIDLPAAPPPLALCDQLYGHCMAVGGGRFPVPKHLIDPVDMPIGLLPHLCLFDVLDDGEFRYRVFGTGLVKRYGQEMTGKLLRDSITGEAVEDLYALYRNVVVTGIPSRTRVVFGTDHGPVAYNRLIVPLSDRDGSVRWVLVGIEVLAAPRTRTVVEAAGRS